MLDKIEKEAKRRKIFLESLVPENTIGRLPLKWEYKVHHGKVARVKQYNYNIKKKGKSDN